MGKRNRSVAIRLSMLAVCAGLVWAQEPPFYADKSNLLVYTDTSGHSHPIGSPADWVHRREHIVKSMQLVMGPLPDSSARVPADPQILEESDMPGLVRRKMTIAVEKGDRLPFYLMIPKKLKGKAPAMLCLHQTIAIGKDEPAGLGTDKAKQYALELAERGYITLTPDYPGFGEYKVDVYAMGYASATMKGIWNHMRCVDYLQSLPEVDPERIGVIGHSLGGHNSLFVSAFDTRLKVAVTSCGFCSFGKYYGGDLTGWTHKGYMPRIAVVYGKDPKKMPFDFSEVLAAIAPRAVFISAPLRDSNFDVNGVRECLEAAKPVFGLLNASEKLTAIHPNTEHDFSNEAREAAYAFVDSELKPK